MGYVHPCGVGAPAAAEEHLRCVCPPLRVSGWGCVCICCHGGLHRVHAHTVLEKHAWDMCTHGCGGVCRVDASLAIEKHMGICIHTNVELHSVCAHTGVEEHVLQAHTQSQGEVFGVGSPQQRRSMHPQLWMGAQGGSIPSCGEAHRVELPTAVEEHM